MERVAVFIDGPNLGGSIDIVKLLERVSLARSVVLTRYYHSRPGTSKEGLTTYPPEWLDAFGLEVCVLPRPQKREQVDIALSVDMVSGAYDDRFDVAVLVAGDADYLIPIRKVQALGKPVEVWAWRGSASNAFPDYLSLDAIRSEILLKRS